MERIILTEKNFTKLRDLIKKNEGKEIIFSSSDDDFNRKVIEKLPVNVLLIPLEGRKDFSKQRNSGFNEIMAKAAKKSGVKIGFFLDELIFSNEKEKIISRIKQNIKLCSRNKVQIVFIEEKEKRNLFLIKSLGLSLGMPTWMVKGSFETLG